MSERRAAATDLPTAIARVLERDLRTPLHSVLGFLELLGMSGLDADQRRTFEYVVGNVDGMVRTVDRLGALTRLAGSDTQEVGAVELPELLGAVASDVDADVTVRIDRDVPLWVRADEQAVALVLSELLDNAVTHAQGPYALSIGMVEDGHHGRPRLRFSVADGGTGLGREEEAVLKGHEPPSAAAGLGLSLVRLIVDRVGGTLRVDNTHGGAHTLSMEVSLAPMTVEGQPSTSLQDLPGGQAHHVDEHADAAQGLRILLVEDNTVNALLAQRQLKMLGHQVETVTRGGDGVDAAAASHFDVILMDRHLPDLDGVGATQQIRAREAEVGRPPTPIIAVTADALARNREECLEAGMDGFLTKPVDLEELRTVLDQIASALTETPSTDGVLDCTSLQELADQLGAPEMVAEVQQAFIAELPLRRLRLLAAIRRSSAPDTITAAEVLRASCETVGAGRLARVCHQIAEAAGRDDLEAARDLTGTLRETCHLTSAALTAPVLAPA